MAFSLCKSIFPAEKNLFRDKIFYAFAFLCWVDKQSGPDIVEPSQPKLFRASCIVDQCVVLRTILLYSVRHLMLYGRAHTHIYRQSIHQQMCLHSLEIFVATSAISLHKNYFIKIDGWIQFISFQEKINVEIIFGKFNIIVLRHSQSSFNQRQHYSISKQVETQ